MKSLLLFISLILLGCSSGIKKSPAELVTGTGMKIPFSEIPLKDEKIVFSAPESMKVIKNPNGWWLFSINSGEETGPRGEGEFSFGAYVFRQKNTDITNYLNADNCDPRNQIYYNAPNSRTWSDINAAYKYTNIESLYRSDETELFVAQNICNFPGGLASPPVESVYCSGEEIARSRKEFGKLCEILFDMGSIDLTDSSVIEMPTFFDNREYIVHSGNSIFRIRTYWFSASEKGEKILQQVLMTVRPLTY